MTLTAFNTTVERRGQEVTVTVPIYSTEPGTVTAAATGCTFPDGADVVIAGTRTWRARNMANTDGFNVPTAGSDAISARDNCTIAVDLDIDALDVLPVSFATASPIIYNYSGARRINWGISLIKFATGTQIYPAYVQSNTPTSNETSLGLVPSPYWQLYSGVKKLLITLSGTDVYVYIDNNTPIGPVARTAPTGVIANPYTVIRYCRRATYWASVLSSADIAAWMAGTDTTAAPVVNYTLMEESPAKPYDASANAYDGVYDLDANYPASQIVRLSTDAPGDPVVPASSIRVTIPAGVASPVTLTLTRPRAGVPVRASDAERIESTTGTITIVDIPAVVHVGPPQIVSAHLYENPVAYCHITTDRPGTVTITCDRTIIDFPATVVVDASLEATMEGAILKGGDCDVTGAM